MRVRILVESLIFSSVIILGYVVWIVIHGYFLTKNYVPDILNSYDSVNELEHKVTFGGNPVALGWLFIVGFVLLSVIYYVVRTLLKGNLWKKQ